MPLPLPRPNKPRSRWFSVLLSGSCCGLVLLKKGDRRKVVCATIAKGRTAVGNDWLAKRLAMDHDSYVSTLVHRIRLDKYEQRFLKKYDNV